MRQQSLSTDDVKEALTTLPGWEYSEMWLRKTFNFPSFRHAIAFVNQIAEIAEAANHHPDFYIRYKTVVLILQTHAANHQITNWDIDLARQIESLPSAKGIYAV